MALLTNNSYVDANVMLYGTSTYNTTTVPSNQIKIKPSDGAAEDFFGSSVTVGSERIVVGASGDNDNGDNSGSAYIFDLSGTQLAKIKPSDGGIGDSFGISVDIGCNRIVVGAYNEDTVASTSGAAYIFNLAGVQIAKIKASDASYFHYFGISVSVGSGRIVVGTDYALGGNGAAYIFDLNGNQLAKIIASDGAEFDEFGISVAVGCGRIVVGASGDDDNGSSSGSAYIFDLNGNQLAKIKALDGAFGDVFGYSVSVGSERIVVGAYRDDDNGSNSGSAYIFDLNGNQLAKIKASDGGSGDSFGYSVAIGSGRIIVGAPNDAVDGLSASGSLYVFNLNGTQLAKIKASDGAFGDDFGYSVAIGSGRILVGAPYDDDNGDSSGSAYIFTTPKIEHILDLLD
jgi:hypothetical protein